MRCFSDEQRSNGDDGLRMKMNELSQKKAELKAENLNLKELKEQMKKR